MIESVSYVQLHGADIGYDNWFVIRHRCGVVVPFKSRSCPFR